MRSKASILWVVVLAGLALGALRVPVRSASPAQEEPIDRIKAGCSTFNPYFATTNFAHVTSVRAPDEPAVIAFNDTMTNDPNLHITLATQAQVGAVYGLAFDAPRERLYAAAYHKRSTAFGPGGPGQVYEIDVATGQVRQLVNLPAGRDQHDYRADEDEPAARWVGLASLGDIEIDGSGNTLFVTNLTGGRIHRVSLPDGTEIDSYRHGAAGEEWARNGRIMGLAYDEGWLYHGVVNSMQFTEPGSLQGYVYRSRPDGSEMTEVARFPLNYARPMRWSGWDDFVAFGAGMPYQNRAQPIISDIEFTADGHMVIGMRDRMSDMFPILDRGNFIHPGVGDILLATSGTGDRWSVVLGSEYYYDQAVYDESAWGGLAAFPGFDLVVASARAPIFANGVGAFWYWNSSGGIFRRETVRRIASAADVNGSNGVGDVESLCPRTDEPDPTAAPTATSAVATATAGANQTATAVALTPAPEPTGPPLNFPTVIAEKCLDENPYAATVCYPLSINFGQLGFDAPTIVTFRDAPPGINPTIYTAALYSAVGSVWGLAFSGSEGALYASAFHKRLVMHGPGGPGAIYRIDIGNGAVTQFADVPDPGPDAHAAPGPREPDFEARDWAGKIGLGDLDLSADERTLFVMNLNDRRIYRYDVVTGTLLGSFDYGAVQEPWAEEDGRPFGLKFYQGRLYHGVVRSAEFTGNRAELTAFVYESAPDGSDMRLVVDFPLDYYRGEARIPGVLNNPMQTVPLAWLPWHGGYNDLSNRNAQLALYPQPMVGDIEFMNNGDMVIGLRDRHTDMSLAFQITVGVPRKPGAGIGDLLLARSNGPDWDTPLVDHYLGLGDDVSGPGGSDRAGMGALARIWAFDTLLMNRAVLVPVGPTGLLNVVEDALWYDADGNRVRQEMVCRVGPIFPRRPTLPTPTLAPGPVPTSGTPVPVWVSVPLDNEYVPSRGLGDIEVLCGPTPTPSPTPEVSPTPTPSPTVTPSPTPTTTPTRELEPIYLPLIPNESCEERQVHADVALVLDVSTSMRRLTSADRMKLEAVQEASLAFVDEMDFVPNERGGHDQVAIVGFNDTAWVWQSLTAERGALRNAITTLPSLMDEGTRLDLALERGIEALQDPARIPDNRPVLILLTDGLPNRVPVPTPSGSQEDTVLAVARRAKDLGFRVYTIGVGRPDAPDPVDRINPDLLRAVASAPGMFYQTPDAEDLSRIYSEIAYQIPCPPSGFWPYRP